MMKLYEDYLRLRKRYAHVPEGQELDVTLEELSQLLFCTPRNAKLVVKKMIDNGWISFQSGRGRGNHSRLRFLWSENEMMRKAAEDCLAKGDLEAALQMVKNVEKNPPLRQELMDMISRAFGISTSTEDPSNEEVETLRLPIFRPIHSLFPSASIYALDTHMVRQVYNTLVTLDQEHHLVLPSVAHYWESSEDGSEWIFYLRKRVRFHHGAICTSQDVVHTFQQLAATKAKWLVKDVADIQALGTYRVRFVLNKPNRMFPVLLTYPQASIIPKEQTGPLPAGTGPYQITRFHQECCTLEAFDSYWGHRAFVDRVEIYNLSSFQQKDFDFQLESHLLLIDTGEGDTATMPDYLEQRELCGTTLLTVNQRKSSALQDHTFRTALHHLINRGQLIEDLGGLRACPSNSFELPMNVKKKIDPSFDPVLGLALLRQSTYRGEPLQLYTYPRHAVDAQWLQQHLLPYDIRLDVQICAWSDFMDDRLVQTADLILFEAISSEKLSRLLELYLSDQSFVKQHLEPRTTVELENLLQEAFARSSDPIETLHALQQVEELLLTQHSLLFLTYKFFHTSYPASMSASHMHGKGWTDFKEVWFK